MPSVVILTGAGISAESGIATFRDQNGLWENHNIEDVATPEAFVRNPELVQRFYNARRAQLLTPQVKPNPAHFALARLERDFQGQVTIVTQNIDNLHERAGSKNIIHMHGELLKMHCARTKKTFPIEGDITAEMTCDCCKSAGSLRPDIVWFGEIPYQMEAIYALCESADLFVAIGTSGLVYPAAGLAQVASRAIRIEVNLDATGTSHRFHRVIQERAGTALDPLVDEILAGRIC